MTILFVCNNLPPIVDGVGDYTLNLSKEFANHGHTVYVVCRKDERISTDYQDITIFPAVEKWNRDTGRLIAAYIRQHDVDVVSLQYVPHGFHPKGLPFGLVAVLKEIKKTDVKVMTFCHEVSVEYRHGTLKQRLLEMTMKHITKSVLRLSDYVGTSICHYRDMIHSLMEKNMDIAVIPIASNIPEAAYPKEELLKLRRTVATDEELIVAFFGMRNIKTSLGAIKHLQEEGKSIKTLFIGKIPASMAEKLPMNCYKTGILDTKDIYKYFLISDIMVLPENNISGCSFKSGSLAAAMQAGLPVITAKGGLTDSSLIDGENILFTDFSSSERIALSMSCLLCNKEVRERIGANAKKVQTDNTWNNTYNGYIELVRR